jgi:hypothetical protein
MNETLAKLIGSVLSDIFIPELISFIREHYATTGQLPTDADIEAAMVARADRIIAKGQAFKNAHPD